MIHYDITETEQFIEDQCEKCQRHSIGCTAKKQCKYLAEMFFREGEMIYLDGDGTCKKFKAKVTRKKKSSPMQNSLFSSNKTKWNNPQRIDTGYYGT